MKPPNAGVFGHSPQMQWSVSPSTLARSRLFRRRRFLAAMTGGVGLMILPSARSAFAYRANERLGLAQVGMAGYGAWQEWIDACCGGPTPLANFEHAAPESSGTERRRVSGLPAGRVS